MLPLRPLTIGDALDLAVGLFRAHAGTMLGIGATVSVPLFLLPLCAFGGMAAPFALNAPSADSARTATVAAFAASSGVFLVAVVFGGLAAWIQAGAAVSATAQALATGRPSIRRAYREAFHKWLSILIAAVLLFAADAAVSLIAIVPCIGLLLSLPLISLVHALFGFAWPAIMLEDLDGVEALRRSYRLARGALPRVWLAMLAAGALSAAAWIGPAALALSFMGLLPPLIGAAMLIAIIAAASCLSSPFAHAVTTIMYYDLRMRQEGYDLFRLAELIRREGAGA